jgi:hypothetical protein
LWGADGTFRALPSGLAEEQRVFQEGQCWACIINIAGEPFKALFDIEVDAWSAFRAACPLDEASKPPDWTGATRAPEMTAGAPHFKDDGMTAAAVAAAAAAAAAAASVDAA